MGALGVVATAITAPSIMRVPFGIVTCLSCLAWILVFERGPVDFSLCLSWNLYVVVVQFGPGS